jgi:predicted Rossmann fold flavoprotein
LKKIYIIGGGAAGYFAAITAAETNPEAQVVILERGKDVLQKVKVSGGGRCNVTHACFMPKELTKNYPRGERELMGAFHTFAAGETIEWFEKRGVELKIEDDGRMFPISDSSRTIMDCLTLAAANAGVQLLKGYRVEEIQQLENQSFVIKSAHQKDIIADALIVASGSSTSVWDMLKKLGHNIVEPVPSLFTFNIKDKRIAELAGLSVPNGVMQIVGSKLKTNGPLLVTHWGLSGPAALRLSAWGARELAVLNYNCTVLVNWRGVYTLAETIEELTECKAATPRQQPFSNPQFGIPARLWKSICEAENITKEVNWADMSKKTIQALASQLVEGQYVVNGKSTFKEEFVTAGGVSLKEIDFKRFESKLFPNLFFAGEVLDVDAITGGFNFQAAWTGGFIAGKSAAL